MKSLYYSLRFFLAAQVAAVKNANIVIDLQNVLSRNGISAQSDEDEIDSLERMINAFHAAGISACANGLDASIKLVAARAAGKVIGKALAEVVGANQKTRDEIEALVAELKAVNTPNGTTKKVQRRLEELLNGTFSREEAESEQTAENDDTQANLDLELNLDAA